MRPGSRLAFAAITLVFSSLATAAASAGVPAEATATHRYYEVRGVRLYAEIQGHGPPIVFLHGGLQCFDTAFRHQRDFFAAAHTVIGIDQRGHGHSPDTDQPLSYREMTEDTAAVLEQLALGPVDLVGHSDGANVALLLARFHPRLVRRAVVSGANLRADITAEEARSRAHWSAAETAAKVAELAASLPPRFRSDYARISPDGEGHWMTLVAKSYQLWLTPVVIGPEELRHIEAPVLVMAGDHDFTSLEETVEIYRALPKGQLVILPATGHGTFSERPELGNLLIRDFLD